MTLKLARVVVVLVGAFSVAGCAAPLEHIPYDVSGVKTLSSPIHPMTLAVVRLKDARPADEVPQGDRYIYRGREYVGTVLDRLGIDPMREVTILLAQHLAKARVFDRVLVVSDPGQADADLYLSGGLVRLRGYVEAEAEEAADPDEAEVGADERRVVAEVMLSDLTVRRSGSDPVLARWSAGWSFHDRRSATPRPPNPYAIAAEALRPAFDQVVRAAKRAVLSGEAVLRSVRLSAPATATSAISMTVLAESSPEGWFFEGTEGRSPSGWSASGRCEAGAWRSRQEYGFLRRLGPYWPSVEVWRCPANVSLIWDEKAEFPARYVGRDGSSQRWFVRQVGPSTWTQAVEDFGRVFDLRRPGRRYLFRLGPGVDEGGAGERILGPPQGGRR